jgi:hypothetical protein
LKLRIVFSILLVLSLNTGFRFPENHLRMPLPEGVVYTEQLVQEKYDFMCLAGYGVSFDLFRHAYKGYSKLAAAGKVSNPLLTICDFSLSSNTERLWILDMAGEQVIMKTLVSHGRNSGEEFAHSFSNKPGTNKSSLGFYITAEMYEGENGLSLRLDGQEAGYNNNARERNIVMHGADYVSEAFIASNQRLGRSQGCPAVERSLAHTIIPMVAEGSCLFIYYPDPYYLTRSKLLN